MDFDVNDQFCLDGQRLVPVGGNQYRTRLDNFSKITRLAGDQWQVQSKAGLIMHYRSVKTSRNAVWVLDESKDTAGNRILYDYSADAALETSITRIQYTGNVRAGTQPFAHVQFVYEGRPDTNKQYYAGNEIRSTRRISRVEAWSGTTLTREYRITYHTSPSTGRSRVKNIQVCGKNGDCMPATQFAWQAEQRKAFSSAQPLWNGQSWGNEFSYSTYWRAGEYPRMMADVNGDALADIVGFGWQGVVVALAESHGFSAPQTWVNNFGYNAGGWRSDNLRTMADVDGDGMADVVGFAGQGVMVSLSTGSGFTAPQTWVNSFGNNNWVDNSKTYLGAWKTDKHPRMMADVNGDGLADVVGFGSDGVRVSLSTGSGFLAPQTWVNAFGYDNAGHWRIARHPRSMADVNGDGMADVVGFSDNGVDVALSTGNGFAAPIRWISHFGFNAAAGGWSKDAHLRMMTDVNGDGLADVVGFGGSAVIVSLSDGNRRFLPPFTAVGAFGSAQGWSITGNPRTLTDVNGDGRVDIVGFGDSGVKVALNQGDGRFATPQVWSSHYGSTSSAGGWQGWKWGSAQYPRMLADVNGDGMADVVGFSHNGVEIATAAAPVPDKIIRITTGQGAVTGFEYKHLTDSSVYTQGSGAVSPKERDIVSPALVVSRFTTDNGVGGKIGVNYHYAGLRVNTRGLGSLGFKTVTTTDESTGIVTTSTYSQTFPTIGMPVNTVRTLNGVELSRETNAYKRMTTHRGYPYSLYVYPGITTTVRRDLNNTLLSTVTVTNSTPDAYGNIQTVMATTDAANGERYTTTTTNTYDNSPSSWILGRLTQATVTKSTPTDTKTRTSLFSYDPLTGFLLTETVEPDFPIAQTTAYTYDTFGNKTSVRVYGANGPNDAQSPARTTRTQYTTNGRFPQVITNAKGHSERHGYDAATGNAISLTGPNGLTTRWTYNKFGHKVSEILATGITTTTTVALAAGDTNAPRYAVTKISQQTRSSSQALPSQTTYMDLLGRTLRTAKTGFDGRLIYQDTHYNGKGQVTSTTQPYYVGNSQYAITYRYDALGRTVSTTDANGSTARVSYQGHRTVTTDPQFRQKTTVVNVLGKTVRVTDPEGSMTYDYDALGNLLTTTDPHGNTIAMTYDARGRKLTMDDPDMGHWQYRYNAFGELNWQKDAKGQVVTMQYDILGRMISRSETEGTSRWRYDSQYKGIGKLAQVTGIGGYSQATRYDRYGRPYQTRTRIDNQWLYHTSYYDNLGRVYYEYGPNGLRMRHSYNAQGYRVTVKSPRAQIKDDNPQHQQLLLDTLKALATQATEYKIKASQYSSKAQYYQEIARLYRQSASDYGRQIPQLEAAAKKLRADGERLSRQAKDLQASAYKIARAAYSVFRSQWQKNYAQYRNGTIAWQTFYTQYRTSIQQYYAAIRPYYALHRQARRLVQDAKGLLTQAQKNESQAAIVGRSEPSRRHPRPGRRQRTAGRCPDSPSPHKTLAGQCSDPRCQRD